ncbi:glycosyltransferase family 4 protein [Carboxylicivirga marina]|uniref:Glycosyltransferase family 4 protein n=1 Tax=Carboxylicivirga marina TaxID=2800988 RepID=A0ABS1HJ22_9BACT|nr:glycosyltransferase family 4 protein [Carboxylicivirga marina]MBK3517674.1 glycosyltransferase family 4 protein [Carboxylicivirga marina]
MHIIAIEYEPSTKRGGQERSYFDILTGLQKKGHTVTLAYVIKGDLVEQYNKHGIKVIQIPTINIYNKLCLKEWISFFKSIFRIKKVKGSTIYINQIMDLPLAAVVKKLKGVKKLVCHLRLPPLSGDLSKEKNQISLLLPGVDQFIVANQNMFEAHTQMGIPKGKTTIIPNGFDFSMTYSQKIINTDKLKLAYIGRIDQTKGILELINALPAIINKKPNTLLTIAGSPMNVDHQSYYDQCKELAKKLGISESVKFVGYQACPIDFLRMHDITIFPSLWNEPFGRVLVESVIAGTPVLAHNIGSTLEILNHKKEYIFDNFSEIPTKIDKLIKNEFDLTELYSYQKSKYSISTILNKIEATLSN